MSGLSKEKALEKEIFEWENFGLISHISTKRVFSRHAVKEIKHQKHMPYM